MDVIFKNLIGQADSKQQPADFSWDELNFYLVKFGLPTLDQAGMQELYDNDPVIQNLVKNITPDGIELNAKEDAQSGQEAVPQRDPNGAMDRVEKTAKQAAKRF